MTDSVSLEVAIEVVLRNGPNFEMIAGLCKMSVEAEREACAKVADQISDKYGWGYYGNEVDTADEIAAAIRARGQA